LLQGLGINPQARAEELQIADFCRIANALRESC
jgi:16S rRNA A1518/A1519 N6-dimethyltransferase RsmA/KsgA/DIM1 with predicted DNA glycosylase/AP lyase activity